MPGVSRSGVTITAGRFLGLDRDSAARFSFLLLIPITLGAVCSRGGPTSCSATCRPGWAGPFLVGTLAAAAAGLAAISLLLGYVRRHDYTSSSSTGSCSRRPSSIVIATGRAERHF